MTDKYYGIYFDRLDLRVDEGGHLENPEALQIVEFEYSEDTDEITACRRVDREGNVIEEEWQDLPYAETLNHVGDDDEPSIEKALWHFWRWLGSHTEWVEVVPETRWHPAVHVCVGVTGCIDDCHEM